MGEWIRITVVCLYAFLLELRLSLDRKVYAVIAVFHLDNPAQTSLMSHVTIKVQTIFSPGHIWFSP